MEFVKTAIIGLVIAVYSPVHPQHKDGHRQESAPPSAQTLQTLEQKSQTGATESHILGAQTQDGPQSVRVISLPARDWVDKSILCLDVVLAVVGVGGIYVAKRTLLKIERQTSAAETQAKHLVESERPFLMVEVVGDEDLANFKVSNRGRSPAKILFVDRMLSPTYLPVGVEPPPIPEYGQQYRNIVDPSIAAEPVNAMWIAHGEHIVVGTVMPKSELQTLRDSLSLGEQIGPSAVWHFGVIVYKGLFGDSYYESRFCYRLCNDQWVMLGPYGYNEYK